MLAWSRSSGAGGGDLFGSLGSAVLGGDALQQGSLPVLDRTPLDGGSVVCGQMLDGGQYLVSPPPPWSAATGDRVVLGAGGGHVLAAQASSRARGGGLQCGFVQDRGRVGLAAVPVSLALNKGELPLIHGVLVALVADWRVMPPRRPCQALPDLNNADSGVSSQGGGCRASLTSRL